ncbi:MAG: ABC transporter permease [Erysipelotrichaceae bacterium]|nr:ABC transporter permease [Erysipelotrichaceae bacterium]
MFKDISTVFKKEIKSILKDKAILLMCILLPFGLMFMEGYLMTAFADTDETEEKTYNAYYINAPQELSESLKAIGFSDKEVDKETTIENIKSKEDKMLVIFPENFTIDPDGINVPNIEIYYNSSDNDSLKLREKISTLLDTLRPEVFTINADASVKYDLGDEDYQAKNMIASMVPGLLVMTIIYGIMSLASNIIAGDKESNFLNTVLITPVRRSSVAIGKALAVMTAAGASAISAFAGLAYLMSKFNEMLGEYAVSYAAKDYILTFIVIICEAFALVGLILIISTLAKTARQAQTLSVIPIMVLFLGSFLTSNAGFDGVLTSFGSKNYLIPMWNASYLTKNILLSGVSTTDILITCVINIVFGIFCLGVVSNLFNNEKIVNE